MVLRWCLVGIVLLLLTGCGTSGGIKKETIETGWMQRSAFDEPGLREFKVRYDTVALEQDLVGMIRSTNAGVNVLVFFGTWCGDSRREVPHFLKIADQSGIDSSRIRNCY